jgi:hypothetical protein
MEQGSPSVCYEGFIDEDWCPVLLGKGFGPKPYKDLVDIWTKIASNESKCYDSQKPAVTNLLMEMQACKSSNVYEGVLSGTISGLLGSLLPLFGAERSLRAVHQTYVPCKSAASVDISLMNFSHEITIHALIEVKWEKLDNRFPEAQACAYAEMFFHAGNPRKRTWAPIFVLTKTHFRFGVAFLAFGVRWCYSEIFDYSTSRAEFSPQDPDDVLSIARLLDFLVQSAEYHKTYAGSESEQELLVDGKGHTLLSGRVEIIGDRVIRGPDELGKMKVVKFYPNKETAESAARQQVTILAALKQQRDAIVVEGCCGSCGICAVIEDFVASAEVVTTEHLISLTDVVDVMHSQDLVHGDLRVQNIVFQDAGAVTLVDFEWAGSVGNARFPDNVCQDSFEGASRHVYPGTRIGKDFDWYCLAEIMRKINCPSAARAADNLKKDIVVSALRKMAQDLDFGLMLLPQRNVRKFLNLKRLDKRLGTYFSK